MLRTLIANAIAPILVIVLLALLLAYQDVQIRTQTGWIEHSVVVRRQASAVANLLNQLESGQRGYLITSKFEFRRPFEQSESSLQKLLPELQQTVADNPSQATAVASIRRQHDRWYRNALLEMSLHDAHDPKYLDYFAGARGANLMISLRTLIGTLLSNETRELEERQAALRAQSAIATVLGVGGLLVGLSFFAVWILRQFRQLNQVYADNLRRLESQNDELAAQTEELTAQTEDLALQQIELDRLYQAVRETNEQLEVKVSERTHELMAAKDEAERASRAKSMFLANMSHELRTPLNAILGYSEMLHEEAVDRDLPTFLPDLQRINQSGKHLLRLINDVLDFSKLEAGRMNVFIETIMPDVLAQDVAATIQPLVTQRGNRLLVDIADDLPALQSDPTKLKQILLNLLANAAKFTEAGEITLSIHPDGERIHFDVKDTGIGLSSEQIAGLFEEFSQADVSTTRLYGGTGLGLAISLRLCRLLGGDIVVVSSPGDGAIFTVSLPACSERRVLPAALPLTGAEM